MKKMNFVRMGHTSLIPLPRLYFFKSPVPRVPAKAFGQRLHTGLWPLIAAAILHEYIFPQHMCLKRKHSVLFARIETSAKEI